MRVRALTAAVAMGLLLSGCTGQPDPEPPPPPEGVDLSAIDPDDTERNGVWYLSGEDALRQVIDAARKAGGVTMEGTVTERLVLGEDAPPTPGRSIRLSVQGTPSDYTASVTAGAIGVESIAAEGAAHVTGNQALAAVTGVPEIAEGFVCVTPGDPLLTQWRALLSPAEFLTSIVDSGAVTASATPPREGAETVDIVLDSGGSPLGVLTVSAVGKPLPLRFDGADTSGEAGLTFTGWGEASEIPEPSPVARGC